MLYLVVRGCSYNTSVVHVQQGYNRGTTVRCTAQQAAVRCVVPYNRAQPMGHAIYQCDRFRKRSNRSLPRFCSSP